MSLEFHESLNHKVKHWQPVMSSDSGSFEILVCLWISEKHESDVEYVLIIKIGFYSTKRSIIYQVN